MALYTSNGIALRTSRGARLQPGPSPIPAVPFIYAIQPLYYVRPSPLKTPKGVPLLTSRGAFVFQGATPLPATRLLISGVTRNAGGGILGSCVVKLYQTSTDQLMETTTSDPSTGAYSFSAVGLSEAYYVVAYKAGSPDVAGTTVNTVVGF